MSKRQKFISRPHPRVQDASSFLTFSQEEAWLWVCPVDGEHITAWSDITLDRKVDEHIDSHKKEVKRK